MIIVTRKNAEKAKPVQAETSKAKKTKSEK